MKKGIETPEGNFVFQGELSGPELDLIVEAGINTLLIQGVLPWREAEEGEEDEVEDDFGFIHPEVETKQ